MELASSSTASHGLLAKVAEIRKMAESQSIPEEKSSKNIPTSLEKVIKTKYEEHKAKEFGKKIDPFFGSLINTGIVFIDELRNKAHSLKNAVVSRIVKKLIKCDGRINKALPDLDRANDFRAKRIERQAVIDGIIMVIIQSLDFSNMSIGNLCAKSKKFRNMFSYEHIAKHLEMPILSTTIDEDGVEHHKYYLQSIKRAMKDLKRAGYIMVQKQCKAHKTKDGIRYYGKPARKTFTTKFFQHLGIDLHKLGKHKKHKTLLIRQHEEQQKEAAEHLQFGNPEDAKRLRQMMQQVALAKLIS